MGFVVRRICQVDFDPSEDKLCLFRGDATRRYLAR